MFGKGNYSPVFHLFSALPVWNVVWDVAQASFIKWEDGFPVTVKLCWNVSYDQTVHLCCCFPPFTWTAVIQVTFAFHSNFIYLDIHTGRKITVVKLATDQHWRFWHTFYRRTLICRCTCMSNMVFNCIYFFSEFKLQNFFQINPDWSTLLRDVALHICTAQAFARCVCAHLPFGCRPPFVQSLHRQSDAQVLLCALAPVSLPWKAASVSKGLSVDFPEWLISLGSFWTGNWVKNQLPSLYDVESESWIKCEWPNSNVIPFSIASSVLGFVSV